MPNADFVPTPGDNPLQGIQATGAIAQILQQKQQSDAQLQLSAAQLQSEQMRGQQLMLENQKLQALQPFVTKDAQSQLALTDAQTGNLIANALNTGVQTSGMQTSNAFLSQKLSLGLQQQNQDLIGSITKNSNLQSDFTLDQSSKRSQIGLLDAQTQNVQGDVISKGLANQQTDWENNLVRQGSDQVTQMMPDLLKQAGISNIPQNVNAYAGKAVTALQSALSASKEQSARAGMFASHATEFSAQNDKMAQQIQLQRLDMISKLNPGQAAGFAATATDPVERALAQATAADPGKKYQDLVADMAGSDDPGQQAAAAQIIASNLGIKPTSIPGGAQTRLGPDGKPIKDAQGNDVLDITAPRLDYSQIDKLMPIVKQIGENAKKQQQQNTQVAGQVAASATPPPGAKVVDVTAAQAMSLPSGTWYRKLDKQGQLMTDGSGKPLYGMRK